ncbi:hypothetical protein [Agromyces seonyuensis]|uniref:Uncharacterized protein n=1 Tax=Agromyces seonyuensis TaxID=2662446 RepID=A0A6I4P0F2_9MICO|nr:hypothetical protein [Agromyces seonyuensis]MWB99851.1 hypothetical protein [Agromyces seonyuensis]
MPSTPVSRVRRLRRAFVTAGFATFVAALAHVIGGGAAPGTLTVVLSLLISLPLAVALAGRRADWRTALSVGVAQLALHLLYSLGLDGRHGAVVTSSGAHAGHGGAQYVSIDTSGVVAAHGAHAVHELMTLAHVAAAVLTIVALAQADRALDAAGRALASTVHAIIRVVALPAPLPALPRASAAGTGFRPVNPALRLSALRHRGPPAAALVLG